MNSVTANSHERQIGILLLGLTALLGGLALLFGRLLGRALGGLLGRSLGGLLGRSLALGGLCFCHGV